MPVNNPSTETLRGEPRASPSRSSGLRRWIRGLSTGARAFVLCAAFLLLIALGFVEENWRGRWAWENCRRGLGAKGVTLDWSKLAPAPVLYFDNRQADGPAEPPGRGFTVSLRDVYGFNPLPATLTPEAARHLLGLQGNLWTEHIRTAPQLEAMAFPRVAAVAEAAWSAPERRGWSGFVRRLPAQLGRYAALGVRADSAATFW